MLHGGDGSRGYRHFKRYYIVITLDIRSSRIYLTECNVRRAYSYGIEFIQIGVMGCSILSENDGGLSSQSFTIKWRRSDVRSRRVFRMLRTRLILGDSLDHSGVFVCIRGIRGSGGTDRVSIRLFRFIFCATFDRYRDRLRYYFYKDGHANFRVIMGSTNGVDLGLRGRFVVNRLGDILMAIVLSYFSERDLYMLLSDRFHVILFFCGRFTMESFLALAGFSALWDALYMFKLRCDAQLLFSESRSARGVAWILPISFRSNGGIGLAYHSVGVVDRGGVYFY